MAIEMSVVLVWFLVSPLVWLLVLSSVSTSGWSTTRLVEFFKWIWSSDKVRQSQIKRCTCHWGYLNEIPQWDAPVLFSKLISRNSSRSAVKRRELVTGCQNGVHTLSVRHLPSLCTRCIQQIHFTSGASSSVISKQSDHQVESTACRVISKLIKSKVIIKQSDCANSHNHSGNHWYHW